MEKFKHIQKIKELYSKGENIIQYLRSLSNNEKNTFEDILISYDFQSGSYIKQFINNRDFNNKYCKELASIIDNLGGFDSIMEAGVGEATTLNTVIRNLKNQPQNILGFDISWSRLKFGKNLLKEFNINNVNLFAANLFELPLLDNSVDIIYTSHSVEPNGGKEEEAIKELYRVARKYVVLLEPAFEFADEEAKARMKKHGYVTELFSTIQKLGYKIIEHKLFEFASNNLNPTGLTIIEKNSHTQNSSEVVCPITHSKLTKINDSLLFSKDCFISYPIIEDIPCLLKENSILTTHLLTDFNEFKVKNNLKI
jgi:ubiquinone/menaquinone biosynthesis C-methylase UbiE/uncharacterized protein YbaR (Trm112 family)